MGGKKSSIKNVVKQVRTTRTPLTQTALAERTGVTRQTIIALEAQRYAPSLELAFRLAHVLEMPIAELFEFTPDWN